MQPLSEMGEAALAYAKKGWRVFPCHTPVDQGCSCGQDCGSVGKHPRTENGLTNATTDLDRVRIWWTHFPDANIGLATGQGIQVVDVDGEIGEDALFALETEFGVLPKTAESRTGRGRHLYFGYPKHLGNTIGKLGSKLDTRGDGGYVLAPPSLHASGATYMWVTEPDRLAQLPDWLVKKLEKPTPVIEFVLRDHTRKYDTEYTLHRYYRQWFTNKLSALANCPPGDRNLRFYNLSVWAGSCVQAGLGEFGYLEDQIKQAARTSGLTEKEIERTWESGYEDGWLVAPLATPPERDDPEQRPVERKAPPINPDGLVITRLADVKKERVEFLWGNRLVRNGVNLLVGDGGLGKALDVDTPVPTPSGWKRHGDLIPGDEVFDENGVSCRVVATRNWGFRPCFRMIFSDDTNIIADENHEWITQPGPPNRQGEPRSPIIRETKEIASSVIARTRVLNMEKSGDKAHPEYRHSISVARPLVLPDRDLLIDPYVLGIWLGDGTSASNSYSSADEETAIEIESRGYQVNRLTVPNHWGIRTRSGTKFRTLLREEGVLCNKHIPAKYLRGSYSQRLDLFRGLMDSDGYGVGTSCEFVNTNRRLAYEFMELARSLGLKPRMNEGRAKLDGRDCGPKYRVMFSCRSGIPFLLERKARRVRPIESRHWVRKVVACEPTVAEVNCVEVDSPSHLYLAGEGMIPTHNSAISLHLALSVTTGQPLPDDQGQSILGDVMLVTYEDPASVVQQRASVLGVDPDRLWIIEGRRDHEGYVSVFAKDDVPSLNAALDSYPDVKLLIIDPWARYLDEADNKEHVIRAALAPLERLAQQRSVSILLVAHINKNADYSSAEYRIAGHSGFKNAARSALMIGSVTDNEIAITHVKHNWSPPAPAILYSWDADKKWRDGQCPLEWKGVVDLDADELFTQKRTSKVEIVTQWLKRLLLGGPQPIKDIKSEALEEGFSENLLHKAAGKLNVVTEPIPGTYDSVWRLP